MNLDFRAIDEPSPGSKWRALLDEFWPAYVKWYLRDGEDARPDLDTCHRELATHMPELVPAWERMVELGGNRHLLARFLTLYRPPPVRIACSQAVIDRDEYAIVRNYDFSPDLSDGVILRSHWTDTPVIATTDCLSGALDGVNGHGLAVAISFGGRPVVGPGFGAPLIVRYLLETCRNTEEAWAALGRLTVHMAYTFTLADADGDVRTVFTSPDRPATFSASPASTNHQGEIEWPEYAAFCGSAERLEAIHGALGDESMTREDLSRRFLEPPLFRTNYDHACGTLYSVALFPRERVAEYRWPTHCWRLSLDAFDEGTYVARYTGAPS